MIIAIDGPAGSGKSTTAKQVARKLGFMHLDTGAMYRAVTLYFQINNIRKNSTEITNALNNIRISFQGVDWETILLNDIDVSKEIRQSNIAEHVSEVSAIPQVREKMVEIQRNIASNQDVVLEGRDIGTKVFPNADLKFFITADLTERGKRRYRDMKAQGETVDLKQIIKNLKDRDHIDSTRKHSPLTKAQDAISIDTTHIEIDEQVQVITQIAQDKLDN